MSSGSILVWNVRGLNARARRDVVRELVASEHPSIVCLQETKLHVISPFDLMQIVGLGFEYFYLPAKGTRGGILLAW
jgi:exonuclease III